MTTPDEIAQQLKQSADARFQLAVARQTLKERIDQQLLVPLNGGLFRVSPELIAFLATWDSDTVYMVDTYNRPVELDRLQSLAKFKQAYQFAMNSWHQEYSELSKIRRASDV
jgi:hypothetical protein